MPDLQKIRKREGEYWKTRFQTVEEALHRTIDECFDNIENQINRATRRIDNELFKFFVKFADVDNVGFAEAKRQLTDTELTDFKMSLEEYIDKAKRNANADFYDKEVAKELEKASLRYRVTRLEAMQYQLKAYMAELFGDINYETDKLLAELYQEQYARTAFEVFKGTGVLNIDFTIPDWDAINILIHKPWRVDGSNFSERYGAYRDQLVQDLNDEIIRVIYNGEGYQGASRALARKMGTNAISGGALYNAKRLIYTESAYFCGLSQDQCFKDLGVKKYQFRSELNTKVCENCQEMDGQIFPLNERRVGVNAPPMHPFCRCVTVPYVDNSNIPGYIPEKRSGRNEFGKSVLFPADMTYKQWYKQYGKQLEENENS